MELKPLEGHLIDTKLPESHSLFGRRLSRKHFQRPPELGAARLGLGLRDFAFNAAQGRPQF